MAEQKNEAAPILRDAQGGLTRAGMEQVLREGGSVLHKGQVITTAAGLPSEADLAAGDEDATRRALEGLEAQEKSLQEQRKKLLAAHGDATKAKREAEKGGGGQRQQEEPVFAGRPASFYEGRSDDDILKLPNVTPELLKDIKAARKSQGGQSAERRDAGRGGR